MRKCIFVLGTRAQLVKIAPVLQLAVSQGLQHSVWFTGQHHESVDDLIEDFDIRSEFIVPEGHMERSSIFKLLVWVPRTFYRCMQYVTATRTWEKSSPLVVVHGDTLSTWMGAQAARWGGGEVVHLESGLSSGKWSDPFPEELLRRLTFRVTRYALCPNDEASQRMAAYPGCIVVNTKENTLLDCVRYALRNHSGDEGQTADFIVSIHRFQNIYKRTALESIVAEIIDLADEGSVWFILHPATELRLRKYGLFDRLSSHQNVRLLPRMAYSDFLALMSTAKAVFSDGGSNQEELSYLGVPTVLYRDRSERPDGLGENIVLRGDLNDAPAMAVRTGELANLRRDSRISESAQPSRQTVEALLRWSGSSEGIAQN